MLYAFENCQLDPAKRVLCRGGDVVHMSARLFDVLHHFIMNRDRAIHRDELLDTFWPGVHITLNAFVHDMNRLRRHIGDNSAPPRMIATVRGHGYRFDADVKEVSGSSSGEPTESTSTSLPTYTPHRVGSDDEKMCWPGGVVPLDSSLYLERPMDATLHAAIARGESIIGIKGPRQVGKTSLLARGLDRARQAGCHVVWTDFQLLNSATLASLETLYLVLGKMLAEQLKLKVPPEAVWQDNPAPSLQFQNYICDEVLPQLSSRLVWAWDEVDRLFFPPSQAFSSEFFGPVRAWHNARGPWRRVTFVMAYATEAHLFITDPHQSPFNVGRTLPLEDFTLEQVAALNHRYGAPLRDATEVERFYHLVGGQPYLVRRGLHAMVTDEIGLDMLDSQADEDEGPFGDHLHRLLDLLTRNEEQCQAVRAVLQDQPCPTPQSFYHLRRGGVVVGRSKQDARLRCHVYARYLGRYL